MITKQQARELIKAAELYIQSVEDCSQAQILYPNTNRCLDLQHKLQLAKGVFYKLVDDLTEDQNEPHKEGS